MRTSEVLNRAADLIERQGWVAGGGWPGEERYGGQGAGLCLEGGLMAAMGISMEDPAFHTLRKCPAYLAVAAHLDGPKSLFSWNDAPKRTAAEVIEVLRAAAAIESAREDQLAGVPLDVVAVTPVGAVVS